MSAIVAEHLVKSFGKERVVDDVSFSVEPGELVALLGPSGGGKSTVLRILSGLETPDSGSVRFGPADVTHSKVQERNVGFVFQHYALFRHMTVRQNVAFGLEVRDVARAEAKRRVEEMLDLVQLAGLGDRYPHQLSGGQRQRVALARSLAPQPRLLLLDEPFGALDAKVRLELRSWLRRLHAEREMTTLFVTHDQEEAMDLAGRVALIHRGRIEQIGTPAEVFEAPASPFVASFVGTSNVLAGRVEGGRVVAAGLTLPEAPGLEEGARAEVFIRPFDLVLSSEKAAGTAQIVRVVRYGGRARFDLRLPGGEELVAESNDAAAPPLPAFEEVGVSVRAASVFLQGKNGGTPSLVRISPEART